MQIPKQQILDFLKNQGHASKADDADKEFPDTVDTDKDSGLLSKFGIDTGALLSKLPTGLTDKLPKGFL